MRPRASASREMSGAGGRGQRAPFCRSINRVGGGGGGRGRERPREGAGEGSGARPRGRGQRQTPRRGTRAAGGGSERRPGGGRWRPGQPGGNPESSMKSPRGRGQGAVLGRLSGDPRHPWLGGGRGGALGVSRGLGPALRGGGRSWVGATPDLTRAGGLVCRCQSAAPLGGRWSCQPRAARLRGFFGNLQMFS